MSLTVWHSLLVRRRRAGLAGALLFWSGCRASVFAAQARSQRGRRAAAAARRRPAAAAESACPELVRRCRFRGVERIARCSWADWSSRRSVCLRPDRVHAAQEHAGASSMLEVSELIYETCKTYSAITQGKFILILVGVHRA